MGSQCRRVGAWFGLSGAGLSSQSRVSKRAKVVDACDAAVPQCEQHEDLPVQEWDLAKSRAGDVDDHLVAGGEKRQTLDAPVVLIEAGTHALDNSNAAVAHEL